VLSSVEADLARRDPDIPGLRTVLDPDAFIAALRRVASGPEMDRAEIAYVKYKPRTFCRVAYRVNVAGAEHELDVRACRPEDVASWHAKAGEAGEAGPFESGRMVLGDDAILVSVFPNDLRLAQLRSLTDREARRRVLRELLPGRQDLWDADIRCLRYWPERRYSAELSGPDGSRALLKAYTPRGYGRARCRAEAFRSHPPLRVASLLGFSDHHRLLAFEWLPGTLLAERLAAGEMDWRVMADTGAALAALHAQSPEGLESWTRQDETDYLLSLSQEIAFICPELSGRSGKLARRLVSQLTGAPPMSVPVHGDFSDGQVLIDGRQVAIVDLDSSYRGDPADDLGSILAQLETYELSGRFPPGAVEQLGYALLGGYRRAARHAPADRVGLYTAAGLLRRARFAFRARKADWPRIVETSLARADAILDA